MLLLSRQREVLDQARARGRRGKHLLWEAGGSGGAVRRRSRSSLPFWFASSSLSPSPLLHTPAPARAQVNFVTRTPCNQTNSRRPYAQLGAIVEIDEEAPCQFDCCTCEPVGGHAVEIDGIRVQPKLGMETELCKTITAELQARKVALGNIGQLKKGEQIRDVVAHVETALGAVMQTLGVPVPSMPETATVASIDVEAAAGQKEL